MYKKHLSLLLALLILASAMSCGSGDTGTNDTTSSDAPTTTAEQVPEYEFRKDWDGDTIAFLNYDEPFEMNSKITVDSENGDILNDAKYKRRITLEDSMGVKIEETNVAVDEYRDFARNTLAAGEDTYDLLYVNEQDTYPLSGDGYLLNLMELDNLNLSEDWWLHELNDLVRTGDTLYCAEGYSNLLVVDTINIMLFNEDIAQKLGLDAPYSLVKEGKWTLDKFGEYLKAGASLNLGADASDDDNIWNYDQPGNGAACSGLLVGTGENSLEVKDGKIVLSAGSEHFYNACDKIASIMSQNQSYMYFKELYGVSMKFRKNQAMFSYGEIVTTQQLRSEDFAFGVLPSPKYDEDQERYYCRKSWPTAGVSIPVTAKNPEKSATFADALNYLSREIVWPVYRKLVLEQKNLRNEESIEMLDIILRSSVPAINTIYDVGSDMINSIGAKLIKGENDISSIVASNQSSIEAALEKLNTKE